MVSFADNDEPRVGIALKNIRKKCARGLASGVRVDDIDLGFRRFEGAKIGSESGLQLLADDFEIGLGQNAFELSQHQRVWREQANRQFR